MKRPNNPWPARILTVALALGLGCAPPPSAPAVSNPSPPVVLIGVDGLEWEIVLEMLRENRLPALAHLMNSGSFGRLETFEPTQSPIIWTSIATGKVPEKHGILGFTKLVDRERRLYTSRDRITKALWNIFSDYDRRVATIGWWMTFPAEQINGAMVAQTNTTAQIRSGRGRVEKGGLVPGLDGQVTPAALQGRVMEIAAEVSDELPALTEEAFGGFGHSLSPAAVTHWEKSQWAFRSDVTYSRVARELLTNRTFGELDLMMIYFGSPDVVGHRFWRYANADEFAVEPPIEESELLSGVIHDTYAWIDRMIGEILDSVEGEANVIVISDHGMHAANQTFPFSREKAVSSGHHRDAPPGVFIAAGPSIRGASMPIDIPMSASEIPEIGTVSDLTPTILALSRIPVGRDMDGVVLQAILEQPPGELSFVETHDDATGLANRPEQELSPEAEKERMEQLRSLGYIN